MQSQQGYVILSSSSSSHMAFSSKPTTTAAGADVDADDHYTSTSEIVATEVHGSHVLTIDGYSMTTRVGRNEFITSSSFTAAGHCWSLQYYPNGYSKPNVEDASSDYISIFLTCDDTEVEARCAFSLLGDDGEPAHSCSAGSGATYLRMPRSVPRGITKFVKRKALEQQGLVADDRLRIRCDISVLNLVVVRKEEHAAAATAANAVVKFVDVPPSDILKHVGGLLSSGDGADVVFEVDGESFRAHRSILAARSPVFKAELFSPVKQGAATCVWVQDMEPRVFRAMLHFVYNDVLPRIDEGEVMAMAQGLLGAADRYCLERLKLICEEKLVGYIDTSSVGTMLELAERHGCHGLKKACLSFLMSGGNLMTAIVTGGLEHVMSSCPSAVTELLMKSCS